MLQYLTIAGLVLTGLGTQLQALHSFQEALTPSWIGGTLIMLGGVALALLSKSPLPPRPGAPTQPPGEERKLP